MRGKRTQSHMGSKLPRHDTWSRSVRVLILLATIMLTSGAATGGDWREKVSPLVLAKLDAQAEFGTRSPNQSASSEPVEFIIFLDEQANLDRPTNMGDRVARGTWLMEELVATADRTQASILSALRNAGAEYRAYWVANMIWVRGSGSEIEALAARAEVARILDNPRVAMTPPVPAVAQQTAIAAVEDNLTLVGAPEVLGLGYTGEGAVVASADTGVQWNHPALKNQYGGWNGTSAERLGSIDRL